MCPDRARSVRSSSPTASRRGGFPARYYGDVKFVTLFASLGKDMLFALIAAWLVKWKRTPRVNVRPLAASATVFGVSATVARMSSSY